MVIIKFPNGTDWCKANWAFRRLAEDVVAEYPGDRDLKLEMERAEAVGSMFLDQMGVPLSAKVIGAMRLVARRTVQGEIPGWRRSHPNDIEGHRMYVESMTELLELIDNQVGRDGVNPN
ncbi:MAG: hypothetical protein WA424_03825 [Candidatus Sulfotelmatobacter sp.]